MSVKSNPSANGKSTTDETKSKNGQRLNAIKHGAFATELFILDEKEEELLEERLDRMIDKALKRLANLKAFKEVLAIEAAAKLRQIAKIP